MANSEVFVMSEGALRVVQASASAGNASGARVWATASAPPSALLAYVRSFSFTSAQQVATISDRGKPTHHKVTQSDAIQLTVNCGYTGAYPESLTASGATTPMYHLEFRANENNGSGRYYQFHGAVRQQLQFTENAGEDTVQMTFVCLGMNGPTGSGYIA